MDRQTDRQTDNGDFIGPSVGRGSNNATFFFKRLIFDVCFGKCRLNVPIFDIGQMFFTF